MSIASLQFLAALLLLSATIFYIPTPEWRQAALAACSAIFLYLQAMNITSWIALCLFVISGYLVALLLKRWPTQILLSAYLLALVAAFLILKKYAFVEAYLPESLAAHTASIVGLSYMLFRQIHFLVDTMQGQIERMSLWSYANYQLNFFTLLSGPIQRYQDFCRSWQSLNPIVESNHALAKTYLRLLWGVVKIVVIATFFHSLYSKSETALAGPATNALALSPVDAIGHFFGILYFFPIYLYLNFSGYCDVVIAGAALVGIKLPENFDKPYLSRNVIDFWTRFHRTLGFWIRDYLFLPLYKGIAERFPKRADSMAFLCYFAAFFVAGIWHGPTANFVVFGLLQAIGVSAAKLWERHLIKRRGRAGLKQYMQSTRIRAIAIVCTIHFECLSLLFFPVDLHTAVLMLRTVGKAII